MKKGEIYYGRKNTDSIHPIVFLKEKDGDFFYGVMLTHSGEFEDNVPMLEKHFEKRNEVGKDYELYFDNSCFVRVKLLKRLEWAPFRKIGQLSVDGINFVESNLGGAGVVWEDYRIPKEYQ